MQWCSSTAVNMYIHIRTKAASVKFEKKHFKILLKLKCTNEVNTDYNIKSILMLELIKEEWICPG